MELIGVDHLFSKTDEAVAYVEGKIKDYSTYPVLLNDEDDSGQIALLG